MILIEWRDGTVLIVDGKVADPEPSPAVRKALTKPATVQRSFEIADGGDEERMVKLAPGDPGHTQAAVMGLPGARLLLNDED